MAIRLMIGAALLAAVAAPVVAQSTQDPAQASTPLPHDRGYDKDTSRTEAIDASGRPAVQAANDAIADQTAAQTAGGAVDDQGQYASDVAAYRAALQARRHVMANDMAQYDARQRAYAAAMADWRAQVRACDRGHNRACRLPTPDPADYM